MRYAVLMILILGCSDNSIVDSEKYKENYFKCIDKYMPSNSIRTMIYRDFEQVDIICSKFARKLGK